MPPQVEHKWSSAEDTHCDGARVASIDSSEALELYRRNSLFAQPEYWRHDALNQAGSPWSRVCRASPRSEASGSFNSGPPQMHLFVQLIRPKAFR